MSVLIVVVLIKTNSDNTLLEKQGKYTIGTTIGLTHNAAGFRLQYEFFYKNKRGYGMDNYDESTIKEGGKYLVRFYPDNLFNCDIYWDMQIPEGVVSPKEGWDSIPKTIIEYNESIKRWKQELYGK